MSAEAVTVSGRPRPAVARPYDYIIVGGGIVGLSVASALLDRQPLARIVLVEKERTLAAHQTGRNSGVMHSGIYYKPGSLKATLCREGNRRMQEFCREHGIRFEICGKVIVATSPAELPLLQALYERGLANGLSVRRLTASAVQELEPAVSCLEGVHVASTGIVDYAEVCEHLARSIQARGGEIHRGARVTGLHESISETVVQTTVGEFNGRWSINCAGLQSDRLARLGGAAAGARIVPFRGEYYELAPARRHLVRNLIYPVPNPEFPFLGVHFTRMIDGSIHAGPNAVLSFKREGYHRTSFNLRDTIETMAYPGFWRLAARHGRYGLEEMHRSFSKRAFVRSLQRLIPAICAEDLVPGEAGVRAQALRPDGSLVDDFLIVRGPRSIHVCNAPSPAATASLEIGRNIVQRIPG